MEGTFLTDTPLDRPKARSVLGPGELQGKVAIITGGAGDIAQHYALALAEAGAVVGLVDLDGPGVAAAAQALLDGGFQAQGVTADVGTKAQATAAVKALIEAFGGINILVNNAGYATTIDRGHIRGGA